MVVGVVPVGEEGRDAVIMSYAAWGLSDIDGSSWRGCENRRFSETRRRRVEVYLLVCIVGR